MKNNKKIKYKKQFKSFYVVSPKNTFIEKGAKIGTNCIIYPYCYISKNCVIGDNCIIYSHCMLEDIIAGDYCKIGPSAHTREKTYLGKNVRLGNFCETKNCIVGDNTKIAHLTYIGDAIIGKNCNFGCGVVFANFDGKTKQTIKIKDNCFIGCNVNLIAPLNIGENCYIGAGSTIDKDLIDNQFALGRIKFETKPNRSKYECSGHFSGR